MAIKSHKKWTFFTKAIKSHKFSGFLFSLSGLLLKRFQSKHVKAFPPKIVASMFFLIKMATNELICHYIEVIKTSIITVLSAI